MSVIDKALDLGKALTETDEYKEMQKAEAAMGQDPEARKLVTDFQNLHKAYQRMQSMGHKIEEEHMDKLREMHGRMMTNSLIKEYEEARSKFDNLLTEVNSKINQGMGQGQEGSCGSGG